MEIIFLLPLMAGLLAYFLPAAAGRILLLGAAAIHLILTGLLLAGKLAPIYPAIFTVSPEGLLILTVISFVFLLVSCYGTAYLEEIKPANEPLYRCCTLLFLATMTMATLADHPIILWISIEATTLVSAPLIFINRTGEALEATWKYVLICSVGIALALLGSFFVILAMELNNADASVNFSTLAKMAKQLDPLWLKAGFMFILIGYGTKMGLAPMHTWLPDAYSQAPSPAAALFSGALESCAFLGIYKVQVIMNNAGLAPFSGSILIGFGLFSMFIAGVFIYHQHDYKRMLAYSSVEHMGIIAFGIGVGGMAVYGAVLHLIHHSLIKSSLFLSSGNILLGFGSRLIKRTGNLAGLLPKTFVGFFGGFAGISGFPPFGLFLTELLIIVGTFQQHCFLPLVIFIACLTFIFAGACQIVTQMSFANTPEEIRIPETYARILPPYVLLLTSTMLCIWMPDIFYQTILTTVQRIGGIIHG